MFIGLLDGQIERISVGFHWTVNFANHHIVELCGSYLSLELACDLLLRRMLL